MNNELPAINSRTENTYSSRPVKHSEHTPNKQQPTTNISIAGKQDETGITDKLILSGQVSRVVNIGKMNSEELSSFVQETTDPLSEEDSKRVTNHLRELFGLSLSSEGVSFESELLDFEMNGFLDLDKIQLSTELQEYLHLIRELSKDSEVFNDFLNQIDAYIQGSAENGMSLNEIMAEFAGSIETSTRPVTIETLEISISQAMQKYVNADDLAKAVETVQVQIEEELKQSDPLVLDLDGDGIELTSANDGVLFDIEGNGIKRKTAFVTGGDAFLVLDRNGNGRIDSGKELFGDQNGAKDGLEELRKYDDNDDGIINSLDTVFELLKLYADENRDGFFQLHEMKSLRDLGIIVIDLNGRETNKQISGGNQLIQLTTFMRGDGSTGIAGDVNLNFVA